MLVPQQNRTEIEYPRGIGIKKLSRRIMYHYFCPFTLRIHLAKSIKGFQNPKPPPKRK